MGPKNMFSNYWYSREKIDLFNIGGKKRAFVDLVEKTYQNFQFALSPKKYVTLK